MRKGANRDSEMPLPSAILDPDRQDEEFEGFSVPGSILRVTLVDFMQYTSVSFKPGPYLNLIVGPNGAGKSSLILAIALGLAGKVGALGRASHLGEFVRTGCQEAVIETQLLRKSDHSEAPITISRKFDVEGKSTWLIDGKASTQKKVERLTKSLQIQTANLCQFLPQDKVHEFSKMNPKELLVKTVEAVGEPELINDQETLRRLQNEFGTAEELHHARVHSLAESKKKFEKLQVEAKMFEEKKELEKKIKLLEKMRHWIAAEEQRKVVQQRKSSYAKAARAYDKENESMEPLRQALARIGADKVACTKRLSELLQSTKNCVAKAKATSQKVEGFDESLEVLENDIERLQQEEASANERIAKYEREIAILEQELEQISENPQLQQNLTRAKAALTAATKSLSEKRAETRSKDFEHTNLSRRTEKLRAELVEGKDVGRRKLDTLAEMNQGQHARMAFQWVKNNREQFESRVYDPLLLNINLEDAEKALFVESCVPPRDLIAFGVESSSDVNELMKQLRDRMNLRVNILKINPNDSPESYAPPANYQKLHSLGYLGVVKDLFDAPPAVKAYLCKMYNLHLIPIFDESADKHLNRLVHKEGLRKFFVGDFLHTCSSSRYGGAVSTMSAKVKEHKWLMHSVDKTKVQHLENALKHAEEEGDRLVQQMNQLKEDIQSGEKEEESLKAEIRTMKAEMEERSRKKNQLDSKRNQMKAFLANVNTSKTKREIQSLRTKMEEFAPKALAEALRLKGFIFQGNECKIDYELEKVKQRLWHDKEEHERQRIEEKREGLEKFDRAKRDALDELTTAEGELKARLNRARDVSGSNGDAAPRKLVEEFAASGFPHNSDECQRLCTELEMEADAIVDFDPDVVRAYRQLSDDITDLEADIRSYERNSGEQRDRIEHIRTRWLTALQNLVERIADNFREFFSLMGFAGDVVLCHGKHEYDFANFGIDVMVKFRAHEPLQRLNNCHQSGGERSVATALYMLALQELTVVPFRCVDEINQGMDAVNERRVFDLLVRVSCRQRDTSSQYFLLTPKLLPKLEYDRHMTILLVNNGPAMCDHKVWDMKKFIDAAQKVF